jgi:hypothetical protein
MKTFDLERNKQYRPSQLAILHKGRANFCALKVFLGQNLSADFRRNVGKLLL